MATIYNASLTPASATVPEASPMTLLALGLLPLGGLLLRARRAQA